MSITNGDLFSSNKKIRILIVGLLFAIFTVPAVPDGISIYPEIKKMESSDLIFRQITEDIDSYYQNYEQNKELLPLQIYSYTTVNDTTIFILAARFNIPYETIVTLNSLSRPMNISKGTKILIPNTPGLFVRDQPVSDLEFMVKSWRDISESLELTVDNKGSEIFYFLPGKKFHRVERAFFLGIMFRFPLPTGYISSGFGNRIHPINGTNDFHNGIDIAAPMGTEVMASRGGTIKTTGNDAVCGNFIVISHENNYETKYCHLKKIIVQLNQQVQSGMIIGLVGSTGMSTGPHLHFEIRTAGDPKDPTLLLPGNNR